MHDVLICGAGPAGSIAALILARAGVRVRVLDRARFPREKLCGDSLNPGALAVLERLGLASAAADGLPVAGMMVTGESGVSVIGRYGDGVHGRILSRTRFDHGLVRAAADAGADVEEGVLVRAPMVDDERVRGLWTAGRNGAPVRVEARLTIAADGGRSRLARALRLARHPVHPRRWAVGAYFENVAGMSDLGEMHVRRGRYVGVAPLPGAIANACVVTADRVALANPGALLEHTLRTDRVLADRFAGARRVTPVRCLGPLAVEAAACGVPGLLLAGDAAGFIDPMTGDGLRFALRGGEIAAEHALAALSSGRDVHGPLAAVRRREFGRKWRFNRTVRALVGSPLAVRAAARGAAVAPLWLQHAIRYAGDLHVSGA
jgi:flavin-dependent dehydrogenase